MNSAFDKFYSYDRVKDISRPKWLQSDIDWDAELYSMCPTDRTGMILFFKTVFSVLPTSREDGKLSLSVSRTMVLFRVVETFKDVLFKYDAFRKSVFGKLEDHWHWSPSKYAPSLNAVREILFPETDTIAARLKKRKLVEAEN